MGADGTEAQAVVRVRRRHRGEREKRKMVIRVTEATAATVDGGDHADHPESAPAPAKRFGIGRRSRGTVTGRASRCRVVTWWRNIPLPLIGRDSFSSVIGQELPPARRRKEPITAAATKIACRCRRGSLTSLSSSLPWSSSLVYNHPIPPVPYPHPTEALTPPLLATTGGDDRAVP